MAELCYHFQKNQLSIFYRPYELRPPAEAGRTAAATGHLEPRVRRAETRCSRVSFVEVRKRTSCAGSEDELRPAETSAAKN